MSKLYLQRHLKSQWNLDDRFAGWTDGPLTKDSNIIAQQLAKEVASINFEKIYASALFRNMDTIAKIFDFIPQKYPLFIHLDRGRMKKWGNYVDQPNSGMVPVYISERLTERYYGRLQGLNKEATKLKYGTEQVRQWRRSYTATPPGGETIKTTFHRSVSFFKKYVEKDLKAGKDILIVASNGSLRAITKYLENIPDDKILEVELPFGALVKYSFEDGKYIKS